LQGENTSFRCGLAKFLILFALANDFVVGQKQIFIFFGQKDSLRHLK